MIVIVSVICAIAAGATLSLFTAYLVSLWDEVGEVV